MTLRAPAGYRLVVALQRLDEAVHLQVLLFVQPVDDVEIARVRVVGRDVFWWIRLGADLDEPARVFVLPQTFQALPHDFELLVRELPLADIVVEGVGDASVSRLAEVLDCDVRRQVEVLRVAFVRAPVAGTFFPDLPLAPVNPLGSARFERLDRHKDGAGVPMLGEHIKLFWPPARSASGAL